MKHIIFIALLFCTFSARAQYPTHPTKQELGRQTTGDGLTFRGSGAPAYTPTGKNNAWMFLDTLSGTLYAHMGGSWQVVSAGGGSEITDVSVSNDTLYITTTDSTFVAVFDDANTNFANSNLTFTGNRVHNLSTRTLTIADGGTYPTFQQSAATDGFTLASSATDMIAQTPGLLQIENSDTITITADRIRMNAADTRIQQVSKDNALNRVMMIDSITERVYYRDVSSISAGGGGSGTVTSVAAGVGLTASPSPITTTGTISADTSVLASKTYVTTRGYTTGSGTTGTIPVWSSSTALGDSPLTVSSGNVTATGTGSFRLPNGTTAQRPGTPQPGETRYSTSFGYLETYGASAWLQSDFPAGTTGQTLMHDGTSWVANSVLTNNGTNVINTGAHQATTYASPTGSCAQPAGGHFASAGATGAIEITLPVIDISVFQMKFQVAISSKTWGGMTFDISLYAQQAGGPAVFFQSDAYVIGGPLRPTANVRFGHDGTNIKVWIEEIGRTWGAMTVMVQNVSFARVSGNFPTALSICSGWTVAMENTAFNTVNETRAIRYQPSRIREISNNAGVLDFFNEVKPVLGGAYIGTFTGAIQINLPDSTLIPHAGNTVQVEFSIRYTSTSVNDLREIKIRAQYSYSSRSWVSPFVTPVDGAGRQLTVRFGREGTVPCIYIGETSSSWTGLGAVLVGLSTYNTIEAIHNALIENTWSITTETSSFSNVGQTITGVTEGALPITSATGWAFSENLIWNNTNTRLGLGNNAPARTLHVTGTERVTASVDTATVTALIGTSALGDRRWITLGAGLSFSSGTLTATGAGTTNLAFSGSSSPVTLTSDTGTDVIFAAGSGLALSQSGGTATYSRTYSLIHTTITGGSTFFGTTAERPDNDTPGSATTSAVGSDFSVSGSTINYTGGSGALIRVQGSISFSVADDGDYYVSMYKEGTEIGATSMRVSCVAGNYYSISLPATTTSGSTNDTFDLRIATVTGTSTTTMHRYGYIIERIY